MTYEVRSDPAKGPVPAPSVDAPLVLYVQLTLGPPHLARIRALDRLPGIRCRGVQLASGERTRKSTSDADSAASTDGLYSTLLEGEYESLSRRRVLGAALRHVEESRAAAVIVDAPADPVQLLLGRISRRRGVLACTRWAATWSDHPRKWWKERLKGFVYRGWDAYFATGQRSVEYLETFRVPPERVFVCGNPVDSDEITRRRMQEGRTHRSESFLFVGRFLDLKNLQRFARAYVRYRAEGGRWTLDLVGFGEAESAVRAILAQEASVRFHGHLHQRELIPMYLHSGCLVLPSYSENWGLVVNEAMHAGMPIAISSVTGSLPELLQEGINGISFDPASEDSMVAALHDISSRDERARATMGERSLEIIAPHSPEAWALEVLEGLRAVGLHEPRR